MKKDLEKEEAKSSIETKHHHEENISQHKALDDERVKRDHVRNELLGLKKSLRIQVCLHVRMYYL